MKHIHTYADARNGLRLLFDFGSRIYRYTNKASKSTIAAILNIICHFVMYLSNIVITFRIINTSIAENGVVRKQRTIQLANAEMIHIAHTNTVANTFLFANNTSDNVTNMINALYKNTSGELPINKNAFRKECLLSTSKKKFNTQASNKYPTNGIFTTRIIARIGLVCANF